jgi:hypothetical protein
LIGRANFLAVGYEHIQVVPDSRLRTGELPLPAFVRQVSNNSYIFYFFRTRERRITISRSFIISRITCALLTGIPFTFTAHAYDIYLSRAMMKQKLLAARTCITISEYNRRYLIAQNPVIRPDSIKVTDAHAFDLPCEIGPRATGTGFLW